MKVLNKVTWTFFLSAILFTAIANSARADFWRWTRPFRGPGQDIHTLIITGNYAESRLLAELIQDTNKQPILLVPAANQKKIYFMPPKNRARALQIPCSELTNFINFIGAKQIVILGDSSYVPDKYVKEIGENQVVWRVTGDSWEKVAASSGRLLNLSNVPDDYKTLLAKLENETNYEREGAEPEQISEPQDVVTVFPTEKADQPQPKETEPIELIDASQK